MAKKKSINFIPAAGRYVLEIVDAPTVTPGGIEIPDSGQEKPMEGVIVSVGPNNSTSTVSGKIVLDYFLGDHVLFEKYSGIEIKIDGLPYTIVKEEEILGKRLK